jgi:hypothetical protein
MLWLIFAPPPSDQAKERILGAIHAPDFEAAQRKVERLLPGRNLTLREADNRWPLNSKTGFGVDPKADV